MQTILRAKTFSLQALQIEGADGKKEVACGYGVHVEDSESYPGRYDYFIYARKLSVEEGTCPLATKDIGSGEGVDSKEWEYDGVGGKFQTIGSVYTLDSRITLTKDDVVFAPPRPFIPLPDKKFQLCLQEGGSDFCREIAVNNVSQVTSGKVEK